MNTIYTFYYEQYSDDGPMPCYQNIEAEDECEAYHKFVDWAYYKQINIDKVSHGPYLQKKMEDLRSFADRYWRKIQNDPEDGVLPLPRESKRTGTFMKPTLILKARTG